MSQKQHTLLSSEFYHLMVMYDKRPGFSKQHYAIANFS